MTGSLLLDLVLVMLLLAQIVAGYREGLVVGAFGLAGLVGGAALGVVVVPQALAGWAAGTPRTLAVVVTVVLLAMLGRLLLGLAGMRLRRGVESRPVRLADAGLGATAGVVSTVLVIWVAATAVRGYPLPAVTDAVAGSRVVAAVEAAVPASTTRVLSSFWTTAEETGFPRVFTAMHEESVQPVAPPAQEVPQTPGLLLAQPSLVKVTGVARSCDRGLAGSGFVYGQDGRAALVVTNAHVVAGMTEPLVQPQGVGLRHRGRVVLFDPARDVAVLEVPGLDAAALSVVPDLVRGDPAIVAGFPLDGPYTLATARVREVVEARGRDIYDSADVLREVYAVYATVEPGNSGGPMLTEEGKVAGLVFARSVERADTGYVLTSDELAEALQPLRLPLRTVDSGACTPQTPSG
ncbi:colicin V production protein [Kineococcus xinjiangensis]|uniref:Colicin V production protein n=1 Tax=Kineococcus xinjiangensis TaxID=512762 RepID=A0A2S6IF50_9ACTN|nr:MarP family serine protease [Kineococcus xinjiangensis]PPK92838.1 colicin V production protein [Kineococcus xinjiangensis]